MSVTQHMLLAGGGGAKVVGGQQEWTTPGSYSFTVPADIADANGTICIAMVAGGGAGGGCTISGYSGSG